ncbi:MAG TPA: undecaprenyl diphosphate synthase family protein, partial [Methanomassiliicoccales archaeon]|nr:undecaprenyl diphosphate synthase family protein [Methanomassiliicoccales archaeon]
MSNEITRIIANTAYQTYEKRLFKEVMEGAIPGHVAIIMDGNRRFAQEIGLAVREGHVKGKDKLE